jgi:hypothetical protein
MFSMVNSVSAQSSGPLGPVKSRPRPEFDAVGGRIGTFKVIPKIELKETYQTNVYATSTDQQSDLITIIVPTIDFKSDSSLHSFNLKFKADFGLHTSNSSEDYQDYGTAADGHIDVTRNLKINYSGSFDKGHEERGAPDEAGGKEPGENIKISGLIGFKYKLSRLNFNMDTTLTATDYDDVTANNGTIINNDDRDQSEYLSTLKIGFDVSSDFTAFTKYEYKVLDFDDTLDDDGANRDTKNHKISIGSDIDITSLIKGEVSTGYFWESYANTAFREITGYTVGLDLTWNVTNLTTLTGGIDRDTKQTTSSDVSSTTNTKLSFGLDHELLRNLIFSVGGSYLLAESNGGTKEDTTKDAEIGTKYLLNRNYYVGFKIKYLRKDSNENVGEYSDFQTTLKLGLQY